MTASKYSKASLTTSEGFTPIERDILTIKLEDNKHYTITEAKKIIKKTKGGI